MEDKKLGEVIKILNDLTLEKLESPVYVGIAKYTEEFQQKIALEIGGQYIYSDDQTELYNLLGFIIMIAPSLKIGIDLEDKKGELRYLAVWERDCDMVEGTRYYEISHEDLLDFKKSTYSGAEGPMNIWEISKEEYEDKVNAPDETYRDRITEAFENGNGTSVMV